MTEFTPTNMKVLVTGAAGFIGAAVARELASRGCRVTGIDDFNAYYDPRLKRSRVEALLNPAGVEVREIDIADRAAMESLFVAEGFDAVINLAAQAGVRYSIENPHAYVHSNVLGFLNVLEGCRHTGVKHLLFASSSSVYGLNGKVPYCESDPTQHPVSLYAATKKSNEMMAHAYAKLYGLPCTGLRFFTVYGPWGRPDMAPFLFADAILRGRPIKVFNNGEMYRDFTYIDDIVAGVSALLGHPATPFTQWDEQHPDPSRSPAPYRILNIGNSSPVKLMDFISEIERACGREARKVYMPMQPGDVIGTYADSSALADLTGVRPATTLRDGVTATIEWFKSYYGLA